MKPLLLLAALGLPFGAPRDQVQKVLASAGISCKPGPGGSMECPRAPAEVAGAAGLRLQFEGSRLARAVLAIDPGEQTFAAFHTRYRELKSELTEKHGEPKTSLEYVDRFAVLADEEFQAVAQAKGGFTSTWKAGELEVRLSLHGEKQRVRLTLSYSRIPAPGRGPR